jgi:hypothetical protein
MELSTQREATRMTLVAVWMKSMNLIGLFKKKNPNFFSLLKFVEKHRGAPGCIGLAKSRPSTRPELATSKTRPKKSLFFFTNRGLIGATLIGAEP